MSISIHPISERDIVSFRHAIDLVARERRFLSSGEAFSLDETTNFVRNNIANGYPHFVALNDSDVVGWCDIIPKHKRSFHAHEGRMGMGVIDGYRRQGIGRRLLATALEAAFSHGLTRIELGVWASNQNAISLYEAFGFVIEGRHRKAICIDGEYGDQLSMALLKLP